MKANTKEKKYIYSLESICIGVAMSLSSFSTTAAVWLFASGAALSSCTTEALAAANPGCSVIAATVCSSFSAFKVSLLLSVGRVAASVIKALAADNISAVTVAAAVVSAVSFCLSVSTDVAVVSSPTVAAVAA